ncbi:cell surface glycoprotein MUC18 [Chanos chanos]|uniref:Cell surface glycoprotein MUC18 n=1 Tax=Chanos chanos TaxID=29144 RepID=A0A6J2WX24_CHACN|nr:cell surface glycoprotein MUC18-like [Chanos chanos]
MDPQTREFFVMEAVTRAEYVFVLSVGAAVDLTIEDVVEVYKGDKAEIHCQYAFTEEPTMLMVQWFVRKRDGNRERISYSDREQQKVDDDTDYTGRITVTGDDVRETLIIHNVQVSDDREFFCQVNGFVAGNGEGKTHLKVFAPPQKPVIEAVDSGISVTKDYPSKIASCEVRDCFPRPNITWYRNRVALIPKSGQVNVVTLLSTDSSGLHTVESELQYKVSKEDREAHFYCEVSYLVPGAVRTAESRPVNIIVHYPTTNVEMWKESPEGLVKEGDTVELRCLGDGNPPPDFIFTREQQPDEELDAYANSLVLMDVTRGHSGTYQCRSLDMGTEEEVIGSTQLTVHYLDPAVVVPKDSEVMQKGERLIATCNALSSLDTSTVWYKDDVEVGTGHMLLLNNATFDTAGEYYCVVTVPTLRGLQTSGSVHIIVQGAPEMKDADREIVMSEKVGRWVNLSCEARGHPQPTITWNVIGSQGWREVSNKVTEDSIQSVVTVKVTSDTNVSCNATNKEGTEMKSYYIRPIPLVSVLPNTAAEGSGVIIVVIIVCILLLAIMGSVIYFLYKKGKLPCGRSGKQEITNVYSTKEPVRKDDIVVEMKADKTEESVLLKGVNGDKKPPNDQYIDLRK